MLLRFRSYFTTFFACAFMLPFGSALAQNGGALERIDIKANNNPLASLSTEGQAARSRAPQPGGPREIPNFQGKGKPPSNNRDAAVADAVLQVAPGSGPTVAGTGFPGASNNDNGAVLGFLVAPPDTDGEVGPNHFVQMINSLTTVFDKNGNIVSGPFASNAIWAGIGGNCEPNNQGDPIVLYDETADRWLVSQFAFPDDLATFSQCVAISQTGDPTGGYNRYEFSFDGLGLNDYPKHGIVGDSITMIANLFRQRGPSFNFAGTFLGVMDKNSMYAGTAASLLGFNIGRREFGFVAGDQDGPGNMPALFATAMSTSDAFDIWQIDVDWSTESASVNQIASIGITPFDSDLCSASRGACIPQPNSGPALESLADRLMHRLQLRDFGAYRTMIASHTVDVGNGRAGLRWYELRETSGTWSLYQEGTFGPDDGENRWMPSAAMNANGDIGIGYMLASANTFVSTAVAGQSAAQSGSGQLDSAELLCAPGTGVQEDTGRSGDYSATSIDPTTDRFWHTNEVFVNTGQFQWSTYVCEFIVGDGGTGGNNPPSASFTASCTDLDCNFTDTSSDSDGSIASWSWTFGDGGSSSVQSPSHTYSAAGSYSVSLTATDNEGTTDSDVQVVVANDPVVSDISLSIRARAFRGRMRVNLAWSGANSSDIDVYRDGSVITTTANDGFYADVIRNSNSESFSYQVCEAGSTTACSNIAIATF